MRLVLLLLLCAADLWTEDCNFPTDSVGVQYSVTGCVVSLTVGIQCSMSNKKSGVFPSLNRINPNTGSGDVVGDSVSTWQLLLTTHCSRH